MNGPQLQPEGSLKREFRRLLLTRQHKRRRHALCVPRYRATDQMLQHARIGLAIVEVVAHDLRRQEPPRHVKGDRLTVARSQTGRYWELLVLRDGVPTERMLAGLQRSPWPPWRLNRLTYFITPLPSSRPTWRT